MKASQLRERIIKPTLQYIEDEIPYSKEAEDLLVATACAESQCGYYIDQINGPARGIFQMEPATETDNIDNYLVYRDGLYEIYQDFLHVLEPMYNPYYAAFQARIKYYRDDRPIPQYLGDMDSYLESLGGYWKRVYNSYQGKGTIEGFIDKCRAFGDFYEL